jgi:hypothetical protein
VVCTFDGCKGYSDVTGQQWFWIQEVNQHLRYVASGGEVRLVSGGGEFIY